MVRQWAGGPLPEKKEKSANDKTRKKRRKKKKERKGEKEKDIEGLSQNVGATRCAKIYVLAI